MMIARIVLKHDSADALIHGRAISEPFANRAVK